jgi:hypothetical protein
VFNDDTKSTHQHQAEQPCQPAAPTMLTLAVATAPTHHQTERRLTDQWLRRRLRQVRWKEWKLPKARVRALVGCGISPQDARQWGNSSRGCWRIAGSAPLQRALPNRYWDQLGLHSFDRAYRKLRRA